MWGGIEYEYIIISRCLRSLVSLQPILHCIFVKSLTGNVNIIPSYHFSSLAVRWPPSTYKMVWQTAQITRKKKHQTDFIRGVRDSSLCFVIQQVLNPFTSHHPTMSSEPKK